MVAGSLFPHDPFGYGWWPYALRVCADLGAISAMAVGWTVRCRSHGWTKAHWPQPMLAGDGPIMRFRLD